MASDVRAEIYRLFRKYGEVQHSAHEPSRLVILNERDFVDDLVQALSRQAGDEWQHLRELSERATAGPWKYRPHKYDDWGCIRSGPGGHLIAKAYAGASLSDDELDQHRRDRTDPYGHNANFIAACVNFVRSRLANSSAPTGGGE